MNTHFEIPMCALSIRMKRAARPVLVAAILSSALAGCAPKAAMVYVLEPPQTVTLTPSASAVNVKQGETITLHVKRQTTGKWKQIPRNQLAPGQCWLYVPPEQAEAEVADSVAWDIVPENAIQFTRAVRMDHARIAVVVYKGTIKLTPVSGVKCEGDRGVAGPSIEINAS